MNENIDSEHSPQQKLPMNVEGKKGRNILLLCGVFLLISTIGLLSIFQDRVHITIYGILPIVIFTLLVVRFEWAKVLLSIWFVLTGMVFFFSGMLHSVELYGESIDLSYGLMAIIMGVVSFYFAFLLGYHEAVSEYFYIRQSNKALLRPWDQQRVLTAKEQGYLKTNPIGQSRPSAKIYKQAQSRKKYRLVTRFIYLVIILIGLTLLVSMPFSIVELLDDPVGFNEPSTTKGQGIAQGIMDAISKFFMAIILIPMLIVMSIVLIFLAYLLFFFLPFFLSLPFSLPIIFGWKNPGKILLFRPFHKHDYSRALVNIVKRHIAPFGHAYTLSDTQLNIPFWIRAPIILGSASLASFRLRKIRKPKDIDKTTRLMFRHRSRTLNWLFSTTKIFTIATVDAGWQATVLRMAQLVDVIVIDVSGFKSNVFWEIEKMKEYDLLQRVIFIVASEGKSQASELVQQVFGENDFANRLYVYDDLDLNRPKDFERMLADVISQKNNNESI